MRSVGLDIGISSIKICVLDGSARRPRVVQFVDHRLPEGQTTQALGPERLGRVLAKLFEKRKLPRENVVVAVPAASALVREIHVPFARDDQIQKTIKFQAESAFHSVQIDDLVVDWYKVETIEERSRLIVCAFRKDSLEERLDAIADAEIDPIKVDMDVAALFNAYMKASGDKADKPTLLVDLGAGSLKVAVIDKGRLRAFRSLRAHASSVTVDEDGAASAGGGASADGAKKRPTTLEELRAGLLDDEREDTFFADDEGRLPVVILDEEQSELFDFDTEEGRQSVLEKVFFEIDRTLARTFLMEPIARIVLSGGGSQARGLPEAFAEHFQADAECFHLGGVAVAKLKGDEKEALEHVGQTALGLALKGMGIDATGFDFRQEEFKYAGTFERLKSGVACTLVLLFVLFFLVAYRFQIIETDRLYSKQQRLRLYQHQIYQTVLEKDAGSGPVLLNLRNHERRLKQRLGESVPDVISVLDVLRDFARAVKETGHEVELKNVNLRQGDRQTVEMIVTDRTHVYDIKEKLNNGDYLVTLEREEIDLADDKLHARLTLALRETKKAPGRPR